MMDLALKRRWLTESSTLGELYVDGVRECFVLEDRYRPPPETKVRGASAIPCGRFEVRITWSSKFKQEMPLLIDVPNFSGVRIHPGNDARDTEGCLLPGRIRHGESVKESRLAYVELLAKLRGASGPIWLTVSLATEGAICL